VVVTCLRNSGWDDRGLKISRLSSFRELPGNQVIRFSFISSLKIAMYGFECWMDGSYSLMMVLEMGPRYQLPKFPNLVFPYVSFCYFANIHAGEFETHGIQRLELGRLPTTHYTRDFRLRLWPRVTSPS
jgi:hypothetical protein